MKQLVFVYYFFAVTSFSFAQSINQFDNNGKRHGIWKKNFKGTKVLRYKGAFSHGKEVGLFKFYKNIKGAPVLTATRAFSDSTDIAAVKFFSSRGKLISEGHMRGKTYIGTWKYYQKNSDKLLILEHYNNEGVYEGERLVYYDNGQIAEKNVYKSGKLQGKSVWYTKRGIVLKTYVYENDELHGEAKFYNSIGKLIIKGQYRRGKKHGVWNYYEKGKLINIKDFAVKSKYKSHKKAP